MRLFNPGWLPGKAGLVAAALAAGMGIAGLASPALAGPASPAAGPHGPVSSKPAAGTPQLVKTSHTETIRQLVECGGMMYAVGSFTTISQGGHTYTRDNVFSFKSTAPYTVSGLNVDVNGEVDSIAFTNDRGCADAYIGGSFTVVHGTNATNIAEVSTSTGAVNKSFGRFANATVETMIGYQSHLLAGGLFTRTNGYSRYYYESLSPSTGHVDGFVDLHLQGKVFGDPREVYNQQLSHSGDRVLVEGNFTSVGGHRRQQIFMLNLSGRAAQVSHWTSPQFSAHCLPKEAFYVRSAAWSPNDSTVYVADTGDHPINRKAGQFPLYGLCDAAAAFPAAPHVVHDRWINYTGCDSLYAVSADDGAVYVAGHPRWSENPRGCNKAGPGAIKDHGLQGLHPGNGLLETVHGRPRYTMSRANADNMLITDAGLWIASTNRYGDNACNSVGGHAGICFLPYS